MRTARRTAKHLVRAAIVLWLASVLVFAATSLLPGDAAQAVLGIDATPESLAALRAQLHLEGSAPERYLSWTGSVVQLDLGASLANGEVVASYLSRLIANSFVLMLVTAAIVVLPSLFLGLRFAYRRDSMLDHGGSVVTLVVNALPEFVIATLLVMFFSTGVFHLLPAVSPAVGSQPPWVRPSQMVLPALTLALALAPYFVRMTRGVAIEILESEFVQYARLSGASEARVLLYHVLPNAIGPVVQITALQLASLAGGVVVVEVVFAYPGLGNGFLQAVLNRDIPVIQAISLFIAAFYVVVNLVADGLTLFVTPRARVAR